MISYFQGFGKEVSRAKREDADIDDDDVYYDNDTPNSPFFSTSISSQKLAWLFRYLADIADKCDMSVLELSKIVCRNIAFVFQMVNFIR